MMKLPWVAALAAVSLSACGSDGTDFTIVVSGDVDNIIENLAEIDVGHDVTGITPGSLERDGDALVITIPADDGYDPVEVRMDLAQDGDNTTIAVAVDVPEVPMGAGQYLSESKVERALEKDLNGWAKRYSGSDDMASTFEMSTTMAAVAIAAQRMDPEDVTMAGAFDYSQWEAQLNGWGSDSGYDDDSGYGRDGDWGTDTAPVGQGWDDGYSGDGDWGDDA